MLSSYPAPLSLCSLPDFDLANNPIYCPLERTVLSEFFTAAKGGEWTESTLWMDEYSNHCGWMGITCDDVGRVNKLELRNNGLSGKVSSRIGELNTLEILDLSDNDIKVRYQGNLQTIWNYFFSLIPRLNGKRDCRGLYRQKSG